MIVSLHLCHGRDGMNAVRIITIKNKCGYGAKRKYKDYSYNVRDA